MTRVCNNSDMIQVLCAVQIVQSCWRSCLRCLGLKVSPGNSLRDNYGRNHCETIQACEEAPKGLEIIALDSRH
jgi:hypothetical protein